MSNSIHDILDEEEFKRRYILQEMLGEGGMARVFRAEQRSLRRVVALKVMRGQLWETPEAHERFLREARIQAGLSHPHVLRVFDHGILIESPFLVMELMKRSILDLLQVGGTFDAHRTLEIFLPLAGALAYLHRSSILHRDIKLQNILLDTEDRAVLSDFGICKDLEISSHLTGVGQLLGSPLGMPPEAFRGQPWSAPGDVYSFGCALFMVLTGRAPHPSDQGGMPSLMFRKTNLPAPSIASLEPDLPPALAELIDRCLDRDASARPKDGVELEELLRASDPNTTRNMPTVTREAVEQAAPATPPAPPAGVAKRPSRARRSRAPGARVILVTSAVLVALTIVGVLAFFRPQPAAPVPVIAPATSRPPAGPAATDLEVQRRYVSARIRARSALPGRLAATLDEGPTSIETGSRLEHELDLVGLEPSRAHRAHISITIDGEAAVPVGEVEIPPVEPWLQRFLQKAKLVDPDIVIGRILADQASGRRDSRQVLEDLRGIARGIPGLDAIPLHEGAVAEYLRIHLGEPALVARTIETMSRLIRLDNGLVQLGIDHRFGAFELLGEGFWISRRPRLSGGIVSEVTFGAKGRQLTMQLLQAMSELLEKDDAEWKPTPLVFEVGDALKNRPVELTLEVEGLERGAQLRLDFPGDPPRYLYVWSQAPAEWPASRHTIHVGLEPWLLTAPRVELGIAARTLDGFQDSSRVTLFRAALRLDGTE